MNPIDDCAAGRISPQVAVARMLLAGAGAAAILRAAAGDQPGMAAMRALVSGRAGSLDALAAEVAATAAAHDASGATPAEGVARIAAFFDRAVSHSPEASVALYSLGDPAILRAATAEIVDWLQRRSCSRGCRRARPGLRDRPRREGPGAPLPVGAGPRRLGRHGRRGAAAAGGPAQRRHPADQRRAPRRLGPRLPRPGPGDRQLPLHRPDRPRDRAAARPGRRPRAPPRRRPVHPEPVLPRRPGRRRVGTPPPGRPRPACAPRHRGERPFALWDGAAFVLAR